MKHLERIVYTEAMARRRSVTEEVFGEKIDSKIYLLE